LKIHTKDALVVARHSVKVAWWIVRSVSYRTVNLNHGSSAWSMLLIFFVCRVASDTKFLWTWIFIFLAERRWNLSRNSGLELQWIHDRSDQETSHECNNGISRCYRKYKSIL